MHQRKVLVETLEHRVGELPEAVVWVLALRTLSVLLAGPSIRR